MTATCRKAKRLLAFLMTLAMMIGMVNVPVFAAPLSEAKTDTKKVTVGGQEYSYTVTLPVGYDEAVKTRNYPVIYVMPDDGRSGNAEVFTSAMDSALATSDIMDVIVVKPVFQTGCDVYEVVSAIVNAVDTDYNTVAEASARAVIGTKVGGYLATMLTYTTETAEPVSTAEDAEVIKVVKWNGTPNLFGMMASIHGDYVSAANMWKDTYGDFYNIATNNGQGNGNFSSQVANRFYTFMDSATEDSLAYADGGVNDIISYFISRIGMGSYYFGGDSYILELTAKNSAYNDAFVTKSVNEAIHGIGNKLVQNMISGKLLLSPQAALASVENIEAVYEINVNELYTKYCGDTENEMKLTVSMTDPDTGEELANKTDTIHVKQTADSPYTNAGSTWKLPNTINRVSTTVTFSAEVLGKEIVLESKPLVRITATGTEPEEQLIDLLGSWRFKPFKDSELVYGELPEAEEYNDTSEASKWEDVYPCLAWWNSDFATKTDMNNYAGYAWYVKEFEIPASFPEGNYVVPVGFFDETDVCFINGKQIGCTGLDEATWKHKTDCWDTERIYSISSEDLNIGGKNVMIILTHNNSGGGGWYDGHPGLYSAAAYNKMTSKPSEFASPEDEAIVKAAVETQKQAIIAKDIKAYADTVDPEYFQSGDSKEMLLEKTASYMEGDGTITISDTNPYVFVSDNLYYYQASRTITTAAGETVNAEVTEYYQIADGKAILYGQHDRFFNQTISSQYRASALKLEEEYVDENFLVYLPEGYFDPENADKRYPTAYVFHQLNSSSNSYAIDGIDKLLDEGISSKAIRETILVIPDSNANGFWQGDWVNMVTKEILPFVDSHYRTIDDPRYRFTAGASMGGSGSYNIGLTNPDLFSGIISWFGAINMGANPLNIALNQSNEYLEYYTHYLVCGNRDLYKFGVPALTLDKKLRTTNAKHFVEIEEGEHNSAFYLPYVIPAFSYQTEDMPAGNAEDAKKAVSGAITSQNLSEGRAVVEADITVNAAISNYLAAIPASDYTKDTNPALKIPVTLTIAKDGKTVLTKTNYISAKAAAAEKVSWDVESYDLTMNEIYDAKVTATIMDQTVALASCELAIDSLVEGVTVNTTVKPLGQTMDSFEVKVTDKTALEGLTKDDFAFSGQASAWGTSDLHEMEGVTITEVSVADDILTLTLSGVTDRHIYVNNYKVTCTNPALSFTNAKVTTTITPVADEFEKVRKADGAEFDYNIYSPANAEEALPVVVAFHGYGDNENLYQNQLAVTWADPENQKKWPCYVIAPVVENYFSAEYRSDLYEKTYNLIQNMVKEHKIDGDRIYVVGKSFGGMATYEFLEKYPDDIAGSIAMCGAASFSKTVMAEAAKMKDIPLWIAHAASDDTVNISNSRELHQALLDAGSKAVKFKEYTDDEMHAAGVDGTVVGYHTVELPVLADMEYREWLFAQNKKTRGEEKDAEIAQEAANAAAAKLPAEITEGTALPTTTEAGAVIAWSTDHAGVTIGTDGKVVVSDKVTADTEVTFTAAVTYNGQTATITKKVKVKGKTPVVVPANKNELNAAIAAAAALKEADYTKETWAAFQAALTAAKNMAAKADAAQAEVDAAKQALLAAQNNLKKPEPAKPAAVSKVTLNSKKLTLGVKETFKLTAKVTPSNAADKKVTWKSSNTKIAAVKNGKITAKKKGSAKITATAGGKSVSCKVTVKAAPKSLSVTPKNKSVKKGKSYTLKVKLPKNTASNKITYTSSNKKIATVSAKGKVKGVKKGKATITVKTFNNKKVKVKVTVK